MAAASLPTVIGKEGLLPQSPASLRDQLLTNVGSESPGYTARLPGSLIDDISGTDIASIALCDQFRVDLVNSLTPYGANPFLMNQIGVMVGVSQGPATLTNVGVVFSGSVGFVISAGFTVTDGVYQYVAQDGGIIGASGNSASIYCVATELGVWTIPAGTVTDLVTSVPTGITVTCTNPLPGVPASEAETEASYRVRCLQAMRASAQGMPSFAKTLINEVTGVTTRLISLRQQVGGGWQIVVGGGDPYQVAYAIFQGILDVSTLVGSVMAIENITNANPGVITTVLNHGYKNGDNPVANGVLGMVAINGLVQTVTVIDEKNYSVGFDTSGMGAYTLGGVLTPNNRNNYVPIIQYPDVYQIIFVSAPKQTVSISVLWNTTATNFVNDAAIQQLAAPALADYVNGIAVGNPINLFQLDSVFQAAIASVLSPDLLTRMVFAVSINGVGVAPSAGTGIIAGDPESYFLTDATGLDMTVTRG